MAVIISLDRNNRITLKPLNYEQKNEYWFSAEVIFLQENQSLIKGFASFHINDFVRLITGIKSLIFDKKSPSFVFDPIEPYLKMKITLENDSYLVEVKFCKGPIFELSKYTNFKFLTSKDDLAHFISSLVEELKQIDSELELKEVSF